MSQQEQSSLAKTRELVLKPWFGRDETWSKEQPCEGPWASCPVFHFSTKIILIYHLFIQILKLQLIQNFKWKHNFEKISRSESNANFLPIASGETGYIGLQRIFWFDHHSDKNASDSKNAFKIIKKCMQGMLSKWKKWKIMVPCGNSSWQVPSR